MNKEDIAIGEPDRRKAKKFSIMKQLLLTLGLLLVFTGTVERIFISYLARKAVTEKVETHLKDKAQDTAQIIDAHIAGFFELLNKHCRYIHCARFYTFVY